MLRRHVEVYLLAERRLADVEDAAEMLDVLHGVSVGGRVQRGAVHVGHRMFGALFVKILLARQRIAGAARAVASAAAPFVAQPPIAAPTLVMLVVVFA